MVIAKMREMTESPRGPAAGGMPTVSDATSMPDAVKAEGTYTVAGSDVSVTIKLRRNGNLLATLPVTGKRTDVPALADAIAKAIVDAVETPLVSPSS